MQYQITIAKISFLKRFYRVIILDLVFAFFSPFFIFHEWNLLGFIAVALGMQLLSAITLMARYRKFILKINCDDEFMQIIYLDFNKEKEVRYDRINVAIRLEITPSSYISQSTFLKIYQDGKIVTNILPATPLSKGFWKGEKIKEVYEALLKWKSGNSISE